MGKIVRTFRRWFRKERAAFSYAGVRTVESMTDIPSQLDWYIFVVRRNGSPRWAVLMCPCGCGDRLSVNLMGNADPHWELSMRRGKASLLPSLWVSKEKCGSHFWLRDNGVFWCPTFTDEFADAKRGNRAELKRGKR